jgi:uncharacterized membrane protein YqaE (UPF0057 family)
MPSCYGLLLFVLSVILPPLGPFLVLGLGIEFWICVLLTCLGYIPGIIYALSRYSLLAIVGSVTLKKCLYTVIVSNRRGRYGSI